MDRKNRKKKIKLLLKWFANSFRKNPLICAGNVAKLPKMSLFEPREKDGELEICPPVGQIEQENAKNMNKLRSNWFGNSSRKKPPIIC